MTVIYTGLAKADIWEMKMYLSNNGNSKTAENIVKNIKTKISDLKFFPKRYANWENSEYRFFSVKNYLVFYRYDEKAEEIIIERVINSRRNIDELL